MQKHWKNGNGSLVMDRQDKHKQKNTEHLDAASCELVAAFFSTLGHPKRVAIFCELRDGRKTVSELADRCSISLPNVSQHLRTMRDKGLVTTEKDGQRVYYAIADERFVVACKMIRDALAERMHMRAEAFESAPLLT
jgi:DNA-binding transcriptional ArsR family regulator